MLAKSISATEFKSKFGAYSAQVHKGPLTVTSHNRPLFVALDPDDYERLKQRDRIVGEFASLSEEEILAAIQPMAPGHEGLNAELDD